MKGWSREEWRKALSEHGTEAEAEAYRRLGKYLFAVAKSRLIRKTSLYMYLQRQSSGDLDDLARQFVQQAVEKAFLNYDEFQWKSHVTTWATTILLNEIRQYLRKSQIREEVLVRYNGFSANGENEQIDPFEFSAVIASAQFSERPEHVLERQEFASALNAALTSLSEKERYAFTECCMRERAVATVAQELETSVDAVYQLVSRARRKLRAHLKELGYQPASVSERGR